MPNFGSKGGLRWLGPLRESGRQTASTPNHIPVRKLESPVPSPKAQDKTSPLENSKV
jgi:hypothetical protein